jgi:hypothetical protein
MSFNVPAVNDVFAVAIKELRSNSSNSKNVAEQNGAEGASQNTVLRSLAAERRRTFTVLLCDVFAFLQFHYIFISLNI